MAIQTTFLDALNGAKESAVHLEMRDSYGVADESEALAKWLAGPRETRDSESDKIHRKGWLDLVASTVARGVVMRRARIVSEPVTDYIKFEYAGTALTVWAGEKVRWLPRRLASDLALPGNDFWLFDGRVALFNLFTGDGGWAEPNMEVRSEPAVAALCSAAFEAVWERVTPHEDYIPA